MALILADRVQETTSTTGTGTLTLSGAVSGFQSFAAIGNANTTYYTIVSGTDWEVGIGTYTASGTTLSRDTVLASSAAGAKITVASGASVFATYPASKAVFEIDSGDVLLPAKLGVGGSTPDGSSFIQVAAGTATTAPLEFIAGTNMTTPDAGSFEYDGTVLTFVPFGTSRSVVTKEQVVVLGSTYTLTSQTAAQKLFNASTNGAVDVAVGTYQFECLFALTGLSATSGAFGFALGGTATKTQAWTSSAFKAGGLTNANSISTTFSTAANTAISAANTNTVGSAFIKGIIRVTVAGTIIPQVSMAQASAAVVQAGSYFKISPINSAGSGNITVGNWS